MKRSSCSLLIAALVGLLLLPSMTPLAAAQESEGRASVPPKWHDETGLKLRPEQFEAYGLTGREWESEPEERERGAAGPLRQDDAAMPPRWQDDSGLKLRGAQFEPYGFTGWSWD